MQVYLWLLYVAHNDLCFCLNKSETLELLTEVLVVSSQDIPKIMEKGIL